MNPKKTNVICVVNHKGGSGKTSISGGLISSLGEMGYKVLGIDGCGQMNLTRSMGFQKDSNKSFYSAMIYGVDLADCIQKAEYFDFIIADEAMVSLDMELFTMIEREWILSRKLTPIRKSQEYDFIIIDTNPTLGMTNFNIMVASDWMFIPIELSTFGIDGLGNLLDFYNNVKLVKSELEILGAVLNKVDMREGITKDAIEVIGEFFGDIVMDTKIRVDTKVKRAQWEGVPLSLFSKDSRASKELAELSREVVKRVKDKEKG